jgi:hypothetical protein
VADTPWHEEPRDRLANALTSQVTRMEMSPLESQRRQNLLFDLELYFGEQMSSLYQVEGDHGARIWTPETLVFNVCYSLTNTVRNRICSFRPRAQFLPNGADYKVRMGARDMTEMSDAWAEEVGYQDQASLAFRDLITGDGGVYKTWIDGATVKGGRFPSWEFMFDEGESIYGEPECAYHVRYMPVEQAADEFGLNERVLRAQAVSTPPSIIYVTNRELVRVVEAWKRASKNDRGDVIPGKRAIVAGSEVVGLESWEFDGFPLSIKRFDERAVGMWGKSGIAMLRSIQIELNELQKTLREAHHMSASKYIWLQQNEMADSKITNDYVSILRYLNTPGQVDTPPAINAEVYQYVELLNKQAYDTWGVSQFIAAGQKQPGLNAAVAIREASDLQTDRLALLSQRWEDMRVDAAGWWWRFTKLLAKRGIRPKWRAVTRGVWRELTMTNAEAEYEIRRFPTSVFGQTVAARLQRATELTQGGFLTKEDALKGLDIPDLSPLIDLQLAPNYAMEAICDSILNDGKYLPADPRIDPEAMQGYATARYLRAAYDGSNYPPERLSMMNRLIDSLQPAVDAKRAKSTPPLPAAPGGTPMPMPGAPPLPPIGGPPVVPPVAPVGP